MKSESEEKAFHEEHEEMDFTKLEGETTEALPRAAWSCPAACAALHWRLCMPSRAGHVQCAGAVNATLVEMGVSQDVPSMPSLLDFTSPFDQVPFQLPPLHVLYHSHLM